MVVDLSAHPCAEAVNEDWIRHVRVLVASALVLLLSCVMTVRETRQVVLPVVGAALPQLCGFHNMFGIDCPGCGMTRSFISLADGDLLAAWRFHPLGIVFFTVLLFQLPFRAMQLLRIGLSRRAWQFPITSTRLLCVLSAAMVVQWIVRLVV